MLTRYEVFVVLSTPVHCVPDGFFFSDFFICLDCVFLTCYSIFAIFMRLRHDQEQLVRVMTISVSSVTALTYNRSHLNKLTVCDVFLEGAFVVTNQAGTS